MRVESLSQNRAYIEKKTSFLFSITCMNKCAINRIRSNKLFKHMQQSLSHYKDFSKSA